jgi:tetratricopeptide (TPR) repeat protein
VKHVWRVTRVALAALGLAFIAATPAVVAAAGVVSAWSLAGATAAAAGIVAVGGIAQDRYRRQRASREEEILGGHDDGPVRAQWVPPKVCEITDPVRLGTHRAVPVENESAEGESVDPAFGAEAPVYIPRDQDGELRELLAACGFVLLVGDSTAGKTRMAFEGMRATLPGHALIAPPGVAAIPLAISRAAEQPRCVLWLDDLERFLGPGGITAADIARLLGGSGQHRVIVATIRAVEQARLTADLRDDDRAWQGLRDVREVLDQARQIRIARMFTASELERARTRAWDPRIAEAIRHADRYGIAEYLAAGPPLLRDLHNARGSAAGTHPQGAAIVTAAIDLRRAGYLSPIPRDLLDEIHGHYLDGPNQSSEPRELLGEAWAWATTRRSATTRLLTPVGGNRVKVFDYLTDAAQRRAGPLDRVLEPVVRSALATAGASDANSLARTAYNQGRWQLAADAWQIACQLLASDPGVGEHHPDTLTCRGNLARVLQDLGRLDEAEAEDRTVLAERELLLGPDHPDTLASRGNLALVLRDLGRLREARAEIRAVLAARRRVQGTDHPDTLASRGNLALVLRDVGRLNEAKVEIRAVLTAQQRVQGSNHPSALASRGNLALVLRDLGRLEQAEDEIRAVLAIALRVLGPDHPRTLTSRNNLAVVLRDLGRLNEAVGEIRAVLAARQLVLGPDHPDSLASRNNLARVLRDLGWLDEAEAEIRAVLAIRLRVLGPDHRSTLASRNNLAGVLHERDRLVEAEGEIRAVLAVMLRVLGPDHPDTLACRGNLALVLRELGRLDEAEIEIPADLADPELALGADDFSTLAEGSASANGVPGTNGSAGRLSSSAGASLSAAGEADDHVNAELLAQQA